MNLDPPIGLAVSFLSFAATNEFQIAYYGIGPTEIRIGYIALNTLVSSVRSDARPVVDLRAFRAITPDWLVFSWGVPVVVALIAFAVMVLRASRHLWQINYEANVDGVARQ